MKNVFNVMMLVVGIAAGISANGTEGMGPQGAKAQARLAAILKACSKEVQAECANIPPSANPWEVVHCLKTNEKSITDTACLTALKHPHHHHNQSQEPAAPQS